MSHDDPKEKKSTVAAALLNALFVGLGNVYAGETSRGLIIIGISVVFGIVLTLIGGFAWILVLPYWIWAMLDGSRAAQEYNDRLTKSEEQQAQEETKSAEIAAKASGSDLVAGMKKLHQLREAQIITEEEFRQKKAALVADVQIRGIRETPEDFLTALIPLLQQGIMTQAELAKLKVAVM